jgi:hypothetical protein
VVSGFTELVQNVTTRKTIANSHSLVLFTTARTKSYLSAVSSPVVVW